MTIKNWTIVLLVLLGFLLGGCMERSPDPYQDKLLSGMKIGKVEITGDETETARLIIEEFLLKAGVEINPKYPSKLIGVCKIEKTTDGKNARNSVISIESESITPKVASTTRDNQVTTIENSLSWVAYFIVKDFSQQWSRAETKNKGLIPSLLIER